MDDYAAKVLPRLLSPGTFVLAAGALLGFLSGRIAARARAKDPERLSLILKAAGTLIAVAGALMIFAA